MSERLFQSVIHQMSDGVGKVMGVIDENGLIIACSNPSQIGDTKKSVVEMLKYTSDAISFNGFTYRYMDLSNHPNYIVFVEGTEKSTEDLATILAISLNNLKNYHDDKFDKTSFIKNVLLDNVLPGDIYIKSRELKFSQDVLRVVCLIRVVSNPETISPYDIIQNLFPNNNTDYVISINEREIILVRELPKGTDYSEVEKVAALIADTLASESLAKVSIGIGSAVESLNELSRSHREAQAAIEVGGIFDTDKSIISYEKLGIGRLIYQLPTTLCEMFINEIFADASIDSLDRDILNTVQCFFENSLNVSETARKMFVHRNTLVYRLDKIKKVTGLDLRLFDDAITFKVALMVKSYLSSKPSK